MAVAYVRDIGLISGSAVVSVNGSFGTLPAVDNHILCFAATWANLAQATNFSDNQSNTYATDKKQNGTSGGQAAAIGSAKVATSTGTFTVTATSGSGTKYWKFVAAEFSGIATTSHLDQTGGTSVGTGQTTLTATAGGANSQANMLVVGLFASSSGDTNMNISNPPSDYTALKVEQNGQSVVAHQSCYKTVSASETSAVTWTFDSTVGEGAAGAIVTYKDADAGGAAKAPVPPRHSHQPMVIPRRKVA